MDVIVSESKYHGREGQLTKLKAMMNNDTLSPAKRRAASENFYKIIAQCNDKKLMEMRHRLMKAAQAGDREWVARISAEMRLYLKEDPESGGETV